MTAVRADEKQTKTCCFEAQRLNKKNSRKNERDFDYEKLFVNDAIADALLHKVSTTSDRVTQIDALVKLQQKIPRRSSNPHVLLLSANSLTMAVMASQLAMHCWSVSEAQTLAEATAVLQKLSTPSVQGKKNVASFFAKRRSPTAKFAADVSNSFLAARQGSKQDECKAGFLNGNGAAETLLKTSGLKQFASPAGDSAKTVHKSKKMGKDDGNDSAYLRSCSCSSSLSSSVCSAEVEVKFEKNAFYDTVPRLVIVDNFTHEPTSEIVDHLRYFDNECNLRLIIVLMLHDGYNNCGYGISALPQHSVPTITEAYTFGYDLVLLRCFDHVVVNFFAELFMSATGRWNNDMHSKTVIGNYRNIRQLLLEQDGDTLIKKGSTGNEADHIGNCLESLVSHWRDVKSPVSHSRQSSEKRMSGASLTCQRQEALLSHFSAASISRNAFETIARPAEIAKCVVKRRISPGQTFASGSFGANGKNKGGHNNKSDECCDNNCGDDSDRGEGDFEDIILSSMEDIESAMVMAYRKKLAEVMVELEQNKQSIDVLKDELRQLHDTCKSNANNDAPAVSNLFPFYETSSDSILSMRKELQISLLKERLTEAMGKLDAYEKQGQRSSHDTRRVKSISGARSSKTDSGGGFSFGGMWIDEDELPLSNNMDGQLYNTGTEATMLAEEKYEEAERRKEQRAQQMECGDGMAEWRQHDDNTTIHNREKKAVLSTRHRRRVNLSSFNSREKIESPGNGQQFEETSERSASLQAVETKELVQKIKTYGGRATEGHVNNSLSIFGKGGDQSLETDEQCSSRSRQSKPKDKKNGGQMKKKKKLLIRKKTNGIHYEDSCETAKDDGDCDTWFATQESTRSETLSSGHAVMFSAQGRRGLPHTLMSGTSFASSFVEYDSTGKKIGGVSVNKLRSWRERPELRSEINTEQKNAQLTTGVDVDFKDKEMQEKKQQQRIVELQEEVRRLRLLLRRPDIKKLGLLAKSEHEETPTHSSSEVAQVVTRSSTLRCTTSAQQSKEAKSENGNMMMYTTEKNDPSAKSLRNCQRDAATNTDNIGMTGDYFIYDNKFIKDFQQVGVRDDAMNVQQSFLQQRAGVALSAKVNCVQNVLTTPPDAVVAADSNAAHATANHLFVVDTDTDRHNFPSDKQRNLGAFEESKSGAADDSTRAEADLKIGINSAMKSNTTTGYTEKSRVIVNENMPFDLGKTNNITIVPNGSFEEKYMRHHSAITRFLWILNENHLSLRNEMVKLEEQIAAERRRCGGKVGADFLIDLDTALFLRLALLFGEVDGQNHDALKTGLPCFLLQQESASEDTSGKGISLPGFREKGTFTDTNTDLDGDFFYMSSVGRDEKNNTDASLLAEEVAQLLNEQNITVNDFSRIMLELLRREDTNESGTRAGYKENADIEHLRELLRGAKLQKEKRLAEARQKVHKCRQKLRSLEKARETTRRSSNDIDSDDSTGGGSTSSGVVGGHQNRGLVSEGENRNASAGRNFCPSILRVLRPGVCRPNITKSKQQDSMQPYRIQSQSGSGATVSSGFWGEVSKRVLRTAGNRGTDVVMLTEGGDNNACSSVRFLPPLETRGLSRAQYDQLRRGDGHFTCSSTISNDEHGVGAPGSSALFTPENIALRIMSYRRWRPPHGDTEERLPPEVTAVYPTFAIPIVASVPLPPARSSTGVVGPQRSGQPLGHTSWIYGVPSGQLRAMLDEVAPMDGNSIVFLPACAHAAGSRGTSHQIPPFVRRMVTRSDLFASPAALAAERLNTQLQKSMNDWRAGVVGRSLFYNPARSCHREEERTKKEDEHQQPR